jgi:hypothetical protein
MKNALIAFSVLLLLCCQTAPLFGQTGIPDPYGEPVAPSGEAMVADLLLVRPVGFVALVFGAAVSIVATPFALATGTTPEVYGRLLGEPYNFTFCRPLGAGY